MSSKAKRLSASAFASAGLSLGFSLHAQHVIWEVEGPIPSSSTNTSLFPSRFDAGADVDGDGIPDVVAGAPFVDPLFKGTVFVFSGADGSVIHEINGDHDDANLGATAGLLGDLDGDDQSEFGSSTFLGFVEVFSGSDGSLSQRIKPPESWAFDYWDPLAVLNVDADGIPDLALGCASCSPSGAPGGGGVAVVSGADGSVIWTHAGTYWNDRLGWSLRNVGDLDHDGVDDLLAGAPGFEKIDEYVQAHDSHALVLSGATGQRIAKLEHVPPWQPGTHNLRFGYTVDGIDANQDGVTELLVGHTYGFMVPFDVSVYDGADGDLLYQSETNDGTTVRSLGDADGDGFGDYLACHDKTAVWKGEVLAGGGRCYVTSGEDYARILELTRLGSGSFGDYAELLGDVDGDSFPDVAIGDQHWKPGAKYLGRLTVMSLRPEGVSVLGQGCPGYQGKVPRIGVRGSPALGGEQTLFLSQAAPGVTALLGIGTSELVPALDLGALGLPGCQLHVQPTTTFSTTTESAPPVPGRASVGPFLVPDDPALLGTPLFAQWWVDGGGGIPASVTRALRLDPFVVPLDTLAAPSPAAGRLAITGISPGDVAAFGAATVTLSGSGFLGAEKVHVGTTALTSPLGFTVTSDKALVFNAPKPAALGTVHVTVEAAAKTSNSVDLTYVPTDPPKLTATGFAVAGQTLNWNFGGLPDHSWFLVVQIDDATTVPFGGFEVLGAPPIPLASGTLDAVGLGSTSYPIPPGLGGSSVHSQVIELDGGLAFVGATNIFVSTILF